MALGEVVHGDEEVTAYYVGVDGLEGQLKRLPTDYTPLSTLGLYLDYLNFEQIHKNNTFFLTTLLQVIPAISPHHFRHKHILHMLFFPTRSNNHLIRYHIFFPISKRIGMISIELLPVYLKIFEKGQYLDQVEIVCGCPQVDVLAVGGGMESVDVQGVGLGQTAQTVHQHGQVIQDRVGFGSLNNQGRLDIIYMNRPVALVCYICGRQFGTKSLAFHLKACQKKWENEQNLKPPKQRRPCPQPPAALSSILDKDNISKTDIAQYNTKSFDSYVEQALVQCQYCQRRFNPSSLIPHQKACKTKPMIKKQFVNKGPMGRLGNQEEEEKPVKATGGYNYKGAMEKVEEEGGDLEACRKCGRTFAADRVGKHQRVCKAEPVAKPQATMTKKVQSKPMPVSSSNHKPNLMGEKKSKWKLQSQQLQQAMKMMRKMRAIEAKGGKLSDLPPPPRSNYDHYIECHHCGRKYAPDVAERHIPKCANIVNKPGGIKPSRIQDKYIAGTGAGGNKSQVYGTSSNMGSSALKPNFGTSSSTYGNNNVFKSAVVQQPKAQMQQPKAQLQEKNPFKPQSNTLGKATGPTGAKQGVKAPTFAYDMMGNGSGFKPNLKGSSKGSVTNKYW